MLPKHLLKSLCSAPTSKNLIYFRPLRYVQIDVPGGANYGVLLMAAPNL